MNTYAINYFVFYVVYYLDYLLDICFHFEMNDSFSADRCKKSLIIVVEQRKPPRGGYFV